MKQQRGMTLVFALVLLTIITIVVVASLEGSSLQSRMIVASMIKNQVYQECRNELEANMTYYSRDANRSILLAEKNNTDGFKGEVWSDDFGTSNPPRSDLNVSWRYVKQDNAITSGSSIDTTASVVRHLYEVDCEAQLRFARESQTQGVGVEGLRDVSIVN